MSGEIVKVSSGIEVTIGDNIPVNVVTALVAIGAKQLLNAGKVITRAVAEFNHDAEVVITYYDRRTRECIEFFSVPAVYDAYSMARHMIDRLELSTDEREKAYMDLARKLEKRRQMM